LSILTAVACIFIIATIAAKIRGLDITCGYFGHASKNRSFSAHIALDLSPLAALIALCICERTREKWALQNRPT